MVKVLIALMFITHGIGHIMGFLESWTPVHVGFTDRPWLLPGSFVMESAVGRAFGLLWLVALIGFLGAGWGTLFHAAWWPSLAVASAVISLVAIVPWWSTVPLGASYGGTLVNLLTLVALLGPWRDQVVHTVG